MLPSISLGRLLYSLLSLGCFTLSLSWPIIVPSLPRRILTIPSHSSDCRTLSSSADCCTLSSPLAVLPSLSLGRLLYSLLSLGRLLYPLSLGGFLQYPLTHPIAVPSLPLPSFDCCVSALLPRACLCIGRILACCCSAKTDLAVFVLVLNLHSFDCCVPSSSAIRAVYPPPRPSHAI